MDLINEIKWTAHVIKNHILKLRGNIDGLKITNKGVYKIRKEILGGQYLMYREKIVPQSRHYSYSWQ